jgi:hypothetical protein
MHVTYGSAFTAKDGAGNWIFRDRIFEVLAKHEDLYTACLQKHLGRHVKGLKTKAAKKRATVKA